MNYSDEDALKEILKRKDTVIRKRRSKACRYLGTASALLFAALITVISAFHGASVSGPDSTIYGAFLLGREAGGYVLAAVIAFVLGVVVTLFCIKYRQFKDKTDLNG